MLWSRHSFIIKIRVCHCVLKVILTKWIALLDSHKFQPLSIPDHFCSNCCRMPAITCRFFLPKCKSSRAYLSMQKISNNPTKNSPPALNRTILEVTTQTSFLMVSFILEEISTNDDTLCPLSSPNSDFLENVKKKM